VHAQTAFVRRDAEDGIPGDRQTLPATGEVGHRRADVEPGDLGVGVAELRQDAEGHAQQRKVAEVAGQNEVFGLRRHEQQRAALPHTAEQRVTFVLLGRCGQREEGQRRRGAQGDAATPGERVRRVPEQRRAGLVGHVVRPAPPPAIEAVLQRDEGPPGNGERPVWPPVGLKLPLDAQPVRPESLTGDRHLRHAGRRSRRIEPQPLDVEAYEQHEPPLGPRRQCQQGLALVGHRRRVDASGDRYIPTETPGRWHAQRAETRQHLFDRVFADGLRPQEVGQHLRWQNRRDAFARLEDAGHGQQRGPGHLDLGPLTVARPVGVGKRRAVGRRQRLAVLGHAEAQRERAIRLRPDRQPGQLGVTRVTQRHGRRMFETPDENGSEFVHHGDRLLRLGADGKGGRVLRLSERDSIRPRRRTA
jgi:hypothetical protein